MNRDRHTGMHDSRQLSTFRKETTMTPDPGRRRGHRSAGARVRQGSAEVHQGTPRDCLRRHEWEAALAALASNQERTKFCSCLLRRTADTRNLLCAWKHLMDQ